MAANPAKTMVSTARARPNKLISPQIVATKIDDWEANFTEFKPERSPAAFALRVSFRLFYGIETGNELFPLGRALFSGGDCDRLACGRNELRTVRKAFRGLLENSSNRCVRLDPICQAKFFSSEIQTNEGGFMFCGGSFVILIRFGVAAEQVNQSIGSIGISGAFCGLNGNPPTPFVIGGTAVESTYSFGQVRGRRVNIGSNCRDLRASARHATASRPSRTNSQMNGAGCENPL